MSDHKPMGQVIQIDGARNARSCRRNKHITRPNPGPPFALRSRIDLKPSGTNFLLSS
jgi:hypothetical protein